MSLAEFFGNNVLVKMVDFFLENRFWDYSKTDVASNIGKTRQSVHNSWRKLEDYEIVIPSRKIGNTTLYRTNLESAIVKTLSSLSLSIATKDVD